jgi:phospholipid/cholesterol/gamma-HCH transport system ATP-binding protein
MSSTEETTTRQVADTPSGGPSGELIRVSGLHKRYGGPDDPWVLEDINFTVKENETVAIIGTSGCGKSTLLKILAGLEDYQEGTVELLDPNFTLVFQYSALFDSLTVFENVAFSLLEPPDESIHRKNWKKTPPDQIKALVKEKLALVGLEDIDDKYPSQLSGGMQKRVSFARGIMSNPKIIFYDEPTSGLDPVASNQLEDFINKLSDELHAASVVVTHTFSTICRTADRVILLDGGKIRWTGTPAELLKSNDEVARHFTQAALDMDPDPSSQPVSDKDQSSN